MLGIYYLCIVCDLSVNFNGFYKINKKNPRVLKKWNQHLIVGDISKCFWDLI